MTESYINQFKPTHVHSPIALSGDRNNIQGAVTIPDNVSQTMGFPSIFSTPRDDGGKSVSRKDMNGLLYLMSQLNYFYQYMGRNPWKDISGSEVNGYPKGACVWYNDKEWVSDGDDNKSVPGDTPAAGLPKWVKLSSTSGVEVSETSIDSRITAVVDRKFVTDLLGYDYTLKVCTSATSGSPVSGTIYFITD